MQVLGTKVSTNEVRKFLLKSLPASLVTLTDESYHMALQYANSEEIVLIDYFAPVQFYIAFYVLTNIFLWQAFERLITQWHWLIEII